ncbi:hypothetical protein Scep_007259 [Stephania cephalantha]|uniref:Uncharacterized protein n=1 Tax=Stephania cephalantha TaxID=152367 RepID=A0AAP0KC47_9MAGN
MLGEVIGLAKLFDSKFADVKKTTYRPKRFSFPTKPSQAAAPPVLSTPICNVSPTPVLPVRRLTQAKMQERRSKRIGSK